MIIQREIEAHMLAIEKLIRAELGMYDASTGAALARRASDAVEHHRQLASEARIEICDSLKDILRSAEER